MEEEKYSMQDQNNLQMQQGNVKIINEIKICENIQQQQSKQIITTNTPNQSYKYSSRDIVITSSGKVSETCGAVKCGAVKFTQDGKIDKRCSAVRNGYIFLTKSGDIDHRCQAYQNQQNQLTLTISQDMLLAVVKQKQDSDQQSQDKDQILQKFERDNKQSRFNVKKHNRKFSSKLSNKEYRK